MRKIKIKPELLSLLTSEPFKRFTSQALIAAYKSLPSSENLNQRQVQQFIFRNLERLESAGFLVKQEEPDGKQTVYCLTELFTPAHYIIGTPHIKLKPIETKTQEPADTNPLLQLKEQLSAYKLELLTTIAEIEEYEALCEQLPSKQPEIQELYNDARNRYSETLVRIKAIESLLSHSGKP